MYCNLVVGQCFCVLFHAFAVSSIGIASAQKVFELFSCV